MIEDSERKEKESNMKEIESEVTPSLMMPSPFI